jgi:hypothetical protein
MQIMKAKQYSYNQKKTINSYYIKFTKSGKKIKNVGVSCLINMWCKIYRKIQSKDTAKDTEIH